MCVFGVFASEECVSVCVSVVVVWVSCVAVCVCSRVCVFVRLYDLLCLV